MGEEISTLSFSPSDYETFSQRMREELQQLRDWERSAAFASGPMTAGLELEAWLLEQNTVPSPDNGLFLESLACESVVPELAKFNFELNVQPQLVSGLGLERMQQELCSTWQMCGERASQLNRRITCIGILPTVTQSMLCLQNMTPRSRFAALNRQVVRGRHGSPIQLDIDGVDELHVIHQDVMLESAATSLQVHLKVPLALASRYLNAFMLVSSASVALAANAAILFGKRLWHDSRITVFEQAVAMGDGRRRVTFDESYAARDFLTLFENRVQDFPILLPVEQADGSHTVPHLRLHNGTIWSWNRPLIGFEASGQPHVRIEHRVMSAGPTAVDMFANVMLALGLAQSLANFEGEPGSAAARVIEPEDQCTFDEARQNFYAAARFGLNAHVTWLGKRSGLQELLLEQWLPLTRAGLVQLAVEPSLIDSAMSILIERTRSGRTAAVWQLEAFDRHAGNVDAILNEYLDHQSTQQPVHTWPVGESL